jgi:hypothetical protein
MRERQRATIQELRLAVECLPRRTRVAMLEGIRSNDIIVGAYSNPNGICPMLAAHRAGGRTDFISFAKAWDRFAFRGARKQAARRATERELLILRTHLEASLLEEDGPAADLRVAMAEHRELVARREPDQDQQPAVAPAAPRPGDPDRSRELRSRPGWAWLRVFRRYDDYERALERLERMHEHERGAERHRGGERHREPEPV